MSSSAVSEDGDAHLACTIAPLGLIGDASVRVHSEDAIAVVVSAHIRVKAAREDVCVVIIAVFAAPVVTT